MGLTFFCLLCYLLETSSQSGTILFNFFYYYLRKYGYSKYVPWVTMSRESRCPVSHKSVWFTTSGQSFVIWNGHLNENLSPPKIVIAETFTPAQWCIIPLPFPYLTPCENRQSRISVRWCWTAFQAKIFTLHYHHEWHPNKVAFFSNITWEGLHWWNWWYCETMCFWNSTGQECGSQFIWRVCCTCTWSLSKYKHIVQWHQASNLNNSWAR